MARRKSGMAQAGTVLPLAIGLLTMAANKKPAATAENTAPAATAAAPAPAHGKAAPKPPSCGPHCGTERWDVKTLTDADEDQVNFTPKQATVSDLVAVGAPDQNPAVSRLNDTEKQAWIVTAKLVGYKQEVGPTGDQDFHIVIADTADPTQTMIVEIPDPQCDSVCRSPKLAEISTARTAFAGAFPNNPPAANFQTLQGDVTVKVTGVGMFDFFHGQTGVAKNCIELHPVLNFQFVTPGPYTVSTTGAGAPPPSTAAGHTCIAE